METEHITLSKQFENPRKTALQFVNEISPRTLRVPNRTNVWEALDPGDRDRAEELRHQVRVLTRELALAMEQSASLLKPICATSDE